MAQKVVTGSHCYILVEGIKGPVQVGWGFDVRVDVRMQNLLIEALGHPHPMSIEPVGVQVDANVSFVRLLLQDPANLGLLPDLGGNDPESIVNLQEYTLRVMAKYFGGERQICVVYGAKPSTFNLTVQGRSFAIQNMVFQGRGIQFTSQLE